MDNISSDRICWALKLTVPTVSNGGDSAWNWRETFICTVATCFVLQMSLQTPDADRPPLKLEVKWVSANVADAAVVHIGSLVITPSCFPSLNLIQSQRQLVLFFLRGKWPHWNIHNLLLPFRDTLSKQNTQFRLRKPLVSVLCSVCF